MRRRHYGGIDDIRGGHHEAHTHHSKFGPSRRSPRPQPSAGRPPRRRRTSSAILTCPMGCGVMEANTIFGTLMAKGGESLIVAAQETPGLHVQRAGDVGGAPVEEAGLRHRGRHHPARDAGRQRGARAVPAQAHPDQVQAPARRKLLVAGQVLRHHQPRHQVHRGHERARRISIGLIGQSDWGVFPVPAAEARLRHRRDELRHPQAQSRRPYPAAHRTAPPTSRSPATGPDPRSAAPPDQRPAAQAGRLGQGSALPRHLPGGDSTS